MRMPKATIKAMQEYAQTLPPSTARAQCYAIANLLLDDESIAERVARGHVNSGHAARAMRLMVDAGCAEEKDKTRNCYGTFIFEDGSQFKP